MANITVTDIDNGEVGLGDNDFEHDGVFNATDSLAKGTILARDTSTLKWRLYVKGGSTNGNGIPGGVLTYAVDAVDGTSLAVLIAGPVRKERLVIDADGDDSNIDATVLDLLRDKGIIAKTSQQLALDDNPQQVDS